MQKNENKPAIILLAAGASTRMGRPKQLLRYRGKSLLRQTLQAARETSFHPVVAVLGARAEQLEAELEGDSLLIAYNSAWATGMGSSVAVGLEAALRAEPKLETACFILVDQPFLDAAHLLQMKRALMAAPEKWGAVSAYGRTLGAPALFRRALFPELLRLHGQKGAKPLIKKYHDQLLSIPFPMGQFDMDTPEDWRAFLKRMEEDPPSEGS